MSTVVEINCCYAFPTKTVLGKGCILTGTLSTANHCSVSYSYFPSFIRQDQNKKKCTNIEELKPKRDGQKQDPCGVPALRKYKNLKYIQKNKISSKRKI